MVTNEKGKYRSYDTVRASRGLPTRRLIESLVESSRNVMVHGDARERKWRGNWQMGWVASTLHTTSEHGIYSVTTADAHTSAASSRLDWRPRRFKWTRPFRWKTKSGFCACAITFQLTSTSQSKESSDGDVSSCTSLALKFRPLICTKCQ